MKILNIVLLTVFALVLFAFTIADDKGKIERSKVTVHCPYEGSIYLDGIYTGVKTPGEIQVSKGTHVIGVTIDENHSYLRKEIKLKGRDIKLKLTMDDRPEPKVWKGLWVGVREATLNGKSTTYSEEELNKAFEYFKWSIKEHFENYSYNTIKWEIVRKDIIQAVTIDTMGANDVILPGSMAKLLPEIKPGEFDNVFSFFKEKDDDCEFAGNYFALAWLDPMDLDIKTGYVTVKFDSEKNIEEHIAWYKKNDPGVYCHEWLHTVGEYFFQSKGVLMPKKPKANNLMVHAADHIYGYTYPWLTWYQDIMAGRVMSDGKYVGIGPENFLKYNIRETAVEATME